MYLCPAGAPPTTRFHLTSHLIYFHTASNLFLPTAAATLAAPPLAC